MAQQQETDEKVDSLKKKGHSWDALKDPEEGKEYACNECGLLARDAVEMICPSHDDSEELSEELQYCENCLIQLLATNG